MPFFFFTIAGLPAPAIDRQMLNIFPGLRKIGVAAIIILRRHSMLPHWHSAGAIATTIRKQAAGKAAFKRWC